MISLGPPGDGPLPRREGTGSTQDWLDIDQITEVRGAELRIERSDGGFCWVIATVVPLYRPADVLYGMTLTLTDITEHKLAEAALQRAHDELEQRVAERTAALERANASLNEEMEERQRLHEQVLRLQKQESLGLLAGGIAHDFNNLLLAVIGNAELSLLELPEDAPSRTYLSDVMIAARSASDLSRQMLDYVGKGPYVAQLLDVRQIVDEMADLVERSLSKKIIIQRELQRDEALQIKGDPSQIRQVVMNLLINAAEAMDPHGGTIHLRLRATCLGHGRQDQGLLQTHLPPGRYVELEIVDSGQGMPSETLAKIFDPFFSTKRTGRGLGLSAVQGIVRRHLGEIEVESQWGRGTSFRILFPATAQATDSASEVLHGQTALAGDLTASDQKILVVDDEVMISTVLERLLVHLGFEVTVAVSGEEALKIFAADPYRHSCVILDLNMPQMDGEECLRLMRSIRGDLPVLISTGFDEQESRMLFNDRRHLEFLPKPYDIKTLQWKLAALLGRD